MRCPKCNSNKINFMESFDHELDIPNSKGEYTVSYECEECGIEFITTTKFNMVITDESLLEVYED